MHDDHLHVLLSYNDEFKLQRRLVHQHMSASAVKQHQPVQIAQAYTMLRRLLEKPEDFTAHVEE